MPLIIRRCLFLSRKKLCKVAFIKQHWEHKERVGQICQEQICTVSETNCPEGVNDKEVIHNLTERFGHMKLQNYETKSEVCIRIWYRGPESNRHFREETGF